MRFFGKKKEKVDINEVFKEQYKTLNRIMQSAQEELDGDIKVASYQLVIEKYNQLLDLIDQGANYDRQHFASLKQNVEKELAMIQSL